MILRGELMSSFHYGAYYLYIQNRTINIINFKRLPVKTFGSLYLYCLMTSIILLFIIP